MNSPPPAPNSPPLSPTVIPEDERGGGTQDPAVRHRVRHHTRVVAHIWSFHLRDVQVSSLLWNEAAVVLVYEGRVLIEDPGVGEIWKHKVLPADLHHKSNLEPPNDFLLASFG